jgi:hypothetical protein
MSQAAQIAADLLRQYGEDAVVIATLRAAEVAALGDVEALAHWDEVAAILSGEEEIPRDTN